MGQVKVAAVVFIWCITVMVNIQLGETVNGFLISKWRTCFSLMDNDKDGTILSTDIVIARERFLNSGYLTQKERPKFHKAFTNWWMEHVMLQKDEITADQFVAFNRAAYEDDKYKFIDRIQKSETTIINLLDFSSDGFISEEEEVLILTAMGHTDAYHAKEFFRKFSSDGEKVPVTYMIYYWTHYLTSDDISIHDPVELACDVEL